MESRRRKPKPASTRRVGGAKARQNAAPPKASQSPAQDAPDLSTLEHFVAGDGQISIGNIHPIPCAAIANDDNTMLAALIRRPGETLLQLLARLDAAVTLAQEHDIFTDEINTPLSRR